MVRGISVVHSCRFISCLFSVTTFSVINIIGKDQIELLLFCSLEWNVWLLCQSDSSHRLWAQHLYLHERGTHADQLPWQQQEFRTQWWRHHNLHHRGPRRISTLRSIQQQQAYPISSISKTKLGTWNSSPSLPSSAIVCKAMSTHFSRTLAEKREVQMSALKRGLKGLPRKKKSSPCGPYFPDTFHSEGVVSKPQQAEPVQR